MCCADLVVAVMTCLGGRRRQTAQQTPTTLIIREQDCLGQKCSAHGGSINTTHKRALQTNAAAPECMFMNLSGISSTQSQY